MSVIDISRTLNARIAVWPGDTPFSLIVNQERAKGATVNLTTLQLSAHTGTHVDAPHHFADDAPTMEEVSLDDYWGPAQVVTVSKDGGPLVPADFAGYDLSRAPRLLVHSAASRLDPTAFPERFVYPSPELADYLGAAGVRLYGTDAPSMDAADSKKLVGHEALRRNGIVILEGLELTAAPDGLYELVALPLKVGGGDGSPVRAALRPLAPPAEQS
jgi:arylformamidase